MQTLHKRWLAGTLALAVVWSIQSAGHNGLAAAQAPAKERVPVVNGGAGSCTADFSVTDFQGKALYDAKISIHIRSGFLGARKLDAMVGTNVDGVARIEGLPEQIKKTAEFTISHGGQSKTLSYDPRANCHPQHQVTLGTK